MKVYQPLALIRDSRDQFVRFTFDLDDDRRRFAMGEGFVGIRLSEEATRPYRVKRSLDFPGGETAPLGDRQAIGFERDPMALSQRAIEILLPSIGEWTQTVPLDFPEGNYSLLNVTNLVDALDSEHSEIDYFPNSDQISRIKRYVFYPDLVRDQWIFKIPQFPRPTFVTDRFVDLANQNQLTGFDFVEVWGDEGGSSST